MKLGIVCSEVDQGTAFLQYHILYLVVIVTFILSSQYKDSWRSHTFEGIPASVHVSGLRIVDILHAVHHSHFLQSVLHSGEIAQTLTQCRAVYSRSHRGNACRKRVVHIVFSSERQFLLRHLEMRRTYYLVATVVEICGTSFAFCFGESILGSLDVILRQFLCHHRIVIPIYEAIVFGLVLQYSHLRVYIVLHAVVVTVEMVGSDVQYNGDIGTEVVHVVKLERAELYHVAVVRILSHLKGE